MAGVSVAADDEETVVGISLNVSERIDEMRDVPGVDVDVLLDLLADLRELFRCFSRGRCFLSRLEYLLAKLRRRHDVRGLKNNGPLDTLPQILDQNDRLVVDVIQRYGKKAIVVRENNLLVGDLARDNRQADVGRQRCS